MPSARHQLLAYAVPRVRRSRDLVDEPTERARIERWHLGLDRAGLDTRLVPGVGRRFSLLTEEHPAGFPIHVATPRGREVTRTLFHVHGGAFMSPADPFAVRWGLRLAHALGARLVLPDYPLAPEHTWRDSFGPMVGLLARWAGEGPTTLLGESAGGGYALALALALRDRGLALPTEMVLLSPWADLTASTPETPAFAARDPWLFLGKLHAYALWWAGSPEDLGRPEVSPALADLAGLPRALALCGTRDILLPGCRLLDRRARAAGWPLDYVEEPDLIHVYPMLPGLPESRRAWRQVLDFLR